MRATHRIQVGLDLVRVSDMQSSVDLFGRRFLDRLFTTDELHYCLAAPGPAMSRLAARFAAKEAARKLLCQRDETALGWRSIEVMRMPSGQCTLVLHGSAKTLARRAGYRSFSLSMTHEHEYASAVVIAEQPREKDGSP